MRTTIRLADSLLLEAKREAARCGMTLTAILEESLRARLARTRVWLFFVDRFFAYS